MVVRRGPGGGCVEITVIRDGRAHTVEIGDMGFVIRVAAPEEGAPGRCAIRHIASGREVHLQSGANLSAFIEGCLLSRGEPGRLDP